MGTRIGYHQVQHCCWHHITLKQHSHSVCWQLGISISHAWLWRILHCDSESGSKHIRLLYQYMLQCTMVHNFGTQMMTVHILIALTEISLGLKPCYPPSGQCDLMFAYNPIFVHNVKWSREYQRQTLLAISTSVIMLRRTGAQTVVCFLRLSYRWSDPWSLLMVWVLSVSRMYGKLRIIMYCTTQKIQKQQNIWTYCSAFGDTCH